MLFWIFGFFAIPVVLLLPFFLSLALLRSQGEHTLSIAMLVLIGVQMVALFLSILKVESALKANF